MADLLARPALEVAPRLLGAVLRHTGDDGTVAVRLTEVEAYAGADDPGSHAYRGPTRRNKVMFGPAGRLYVYFTYGMHHCCNVVAGEEGRASAVLLRAGEVVEGTELARARRVRSPDRDLARGPARLCQALGIDLRHNGADLAQGPLRLEPATADAAPVGTDPVGAGQVSTGQVSTGQVSTGPRVGLRDAADRPWRFWLAGEPTVSAYRPATRRPSR